MNIKSKLKNTISSRLRIIIPAIFGAAEGLLIFNLLQSASFPTLVTFFLALVIALAAGFGLHLGAHFICKAKTPISSRIRYVIVLSLAFLVALALGIWRATIYNDTVNINSQIELHSNSSTHASFSPWPFVVISFISFLVALAFEIKYWQSDEDKKKQKNYEDKTRELRKIEQEYKDLINEIHGLKTSSNLDSGLIIRKQEYAAINEQRILTLAQHILSHYEGVNVEYRIDGDCPSFFGQSITPHFKLYFSELFNNIKQVK